MYGVVTNVITQHPTPSPPPPPLLQCCPAAVLPPRRAAVLHQRKPNADAHFTSLSCRPITRVVMEVVYLASGHVLGASSAYQVTGGVGGAQTFF